MTIKDWVYQLFNIKKTYVVKFRVTYGEEDLGQYTTLMDIKGKFSAKEESLIYESLRQVTKGSLYMGIEDRLKKAKGLQMTEEAILELINTEEVTVGLVDIRRIT